ncbi:MAG: glucosaminidase domain-containing protein [Lentimicrobiaceae bacterium]|nr:glucosaminidase domain-containing protein [Lentimicrobiaceae bacterium]
MKKRFSTVFFLFVSSVLFGQSYTKSDIAVYIQTYAGIAVEKMREHQIPASITLAQGILESAAGKSELAQNANNHFGIKCGGKWYGKTYTKDDDKADECFRKYDSPEQSFEDHTEFLQAPRYADLFSLEITDYKAWAHGLKKAGYATHPQYAERLIRVIEDYELMLYDTVSDVNYLAKPARVQAGKTQRKSTKKHSAAPFAGRSAEIVGAYRGFPQVPYPYTLRPVFINNGVHFVVAKEGDTYFSIAVDVQLTIAELKRYNEMLFKKQDPYVGEIIYLEKKKQYANVPTHTVQRGETLRSIAQLYACKSKTISKLNGLSKHSELRIGEVLKLR